jgi:glycerophosphoryl diester phosphodiesterase
LRSALAVGADMVEVDVRRTADGALVLMHDATLRRTTDAVRRHPTRSPWRVHDFTLAELRGLDAGSWKSSTFTGEPVPTLEEAWEVLRRAGSRLLLEVKDPGSQPGIMSDVVQSLTFPSPAGTPLRDHVIVQSFDSHAVRTFHEQLPDVPVGLLSYVPVHELPRVAPWASYINPHHRWADRPYVDAVHGAGLGCLPWTVDAPRRVRRALRAGADGVISNRPDLVRAVSVVQVGPRGAD